MQLGEIGVQVAEIGAHAAQSTHISQTLEVSLRARTVCAWVPCDFMKLSKMEVFQLTDVIQ